MNGEQHDQQENKVEQREPTPKPDAATGLPEEVSQVGANYMPISAQALKEAGWTAITANVDKQPYADWLNPKTGEFRRSFAPAPAPAAKKQ